MKLEGKNEYKIDPQNVIFDTEKNRPTLDVTNQKNATVLFDQDINSWLSGTDGEDVTEAIKLVSDANVLIKGGVVVDFEMLDNRGNMTIERNLGSDQDRDHTQAVIKGNSVNSGNITVGGTLDATADGVSFTNKKDATVTAQSFESGTMDDEDRGRALFQDLTNEGTLVTEVSSPNKGTWGGLIKVEGKLTNRGPINNDGELIVANITNEGAVITLGEDPYAYVSIAKGSLTDAKKGGKLVLADATTYEFYVNAMRKTQNLGDEEDGELTGVIETTVDSQEEYETLMYNYHRYIATEQETALSVLNTIYVKSSLTLSSADGNKELKDITLYLEDATLNVTAAAENVAFGALYANKGNNAVSVNSNGTKTINAGRVDVAAGAGLTVGAGVTMLVAYDKDNAVNVEGNLTNYGTINAEENAVGLDLRNVNAEGRINTYVAKGGSLSNYGTLSQPCSDKYDSDAYEALSELIQGLYNGDTDNPYRGNEIKNGSPRVELIQDENATAWTNATGWNKTDEPNNYVTVGKLKEILENGSLTFVGNWQAIKYKHVNGYYYYVYLGGSENGTQDVVTDEEFTEWQKILGELTFKDGKLADNKIIAKTYFYVTVNNGTITLGEEPAEAYGYVELNKGTVDGDFVK